MSIISPSDELSSEASPSEDAAEPETTPKAQLQNESYSDPAEIPDEGTLIETTESSPSATTFATNMSSAEAETPTVNLPMEENILGEGKKSIVMSTFSPGDFDQSIGSGMQPPLSEERDASPTAPDRKQEEIQPTTPNEQLTEEGENAEDGALVERKKHTSKHQPCRQIWTWLTKVFKICLK